MLRPSPITRPVKQQQEYITEKQQNSSVATRMFVIKK